MDLLVGARGEDLDQALLIRADALWAEAQPREQQGQMASEGAHGGLPTPYRDGIFDLFGVTVRRRPHQADDQPLELAGQLVLQVCNQVLAQEQKGAGNPLLHSISEWGQGATGPCMGWLVATTTTCICSGGMDQGVFLPLPFHRGTCRLGRSPLAACCFWM